MAAGGLASDPLADGGPADRLSRDRRPAVPMYFGADQSRRWIYQAVAARGIGSAHLYADIAAGFDVALSPLPADETTAWTPSRDVWPIRP